MEDATHSIGVGNLKKTENNVYTHVVDLFAAPEVESAIVKRRDVTYFPTVLSDSGPLEFILQKQGSDYMKLSTVAMLLQLKIVKDTDTAVKEAEIVGPCNLIGNSLFRSIEVLILIYI